MGIKSSRPGQEGDKGLAGCLEGVGFPHMVPAGRRHLSLSSGACDHIPDEKGQSSLQACPLALGRGTNKAERLLEGDLILGEEVQG